MAPHITASPAEGVAAADMPTPTAKEMGKRQKTSTSAVKHAMTTPYVFPKECAFSSMFSMASRSRHFDDKFGTVQETFLYIPRREEHGHSKVDGRWRSCQPTGSTLGYEAGQSIKDVYRGAVCPAGWIAHDVGLMSQEDYYTAEAERKGLPQTWTTAMCCMSGDLLKDDHWNINYEAIGWQRRICVSTSSYPYHVYPPPSTHIFPSYTMEYYTTETTFSPYTMQYITIDENSSTSTRSVETVTDEYDSRFVTALAPFMAGRAFYPPISIVWLEEDNKTLKPKWPAMTSDMLLPTWPLTDNEQSAHNELGIYDNRGRGRIEINTDGFMPNKVAIPIISVLAVLLLAALAGVGFLLWKGKGAIRPTLKAKNSQLEIPIEDEACSTAHLAGRSSAGDDIELRER